MTLDSFNALIQFFRITNDTATLLSVIGEYPGFCGPLRKDAEELAAMWAEVASVIQKHLARNQDKLEQ